MLDAEVCIRRAVAGDAVGEVDLRPVPCHGRWGPASTRNFSHPAEQMHIHNQYYSVIPK